MHAHAQGCQPPRSAQLGASVAVAVAEERALRALDAASLLLSRNLRGFWMAHRRAEPTGWVFLGFFGIGGSKTLTNTRNWN